MTFYIVPTLYVFLWEFPKQKGITDLNSILLQIIMEAFPLSGGKFMIKGLTGSGNILGRVA